MSSRLLINYSQASRRSMISAWVTTMTMSAQGQLLIEDDMNLESSIENTRSGQQRIGQITLPDNVDFNKKLIDEWSQSGARIRYLTEDTWHEIKSVRIYEQKDPTNFSLSFTFEPINETQYVLKSEDIPLFEKLIEKESDKSYQDTVVIFGAGASASYLPGGNELLMTMLNQTPKQSIIDFLEDFFQTDFNTVKSFPSFNQVLNIIEIALEREESLNHKYDIDQLRQIKKQLIDQMRKFMIRVMAEPETSDPYSYLLSNFRSIIDSGRNVSLITLNYDLFLDHALKQVFKKEEINYVLDFQGEERTEDQLIDVVKLHGSLNWMICPTCFRPKRFDDSLNTMFDELCSHDKTPLQEFIFPPMQEKAQVHPHWLKLLEHAENLIGNCDRVIFVGYSLSDDDSIFRFKLKKRIYRPENPITIQVIDQKGDKIGVSDNWLAKHYAQYFGSVDYRPIGFENFAKEPY